jgi:hypothetical protein
MTEITPKLRNFLYFHIVADIMSNILRDALTIKCDGIPSEYSRLCATVAVSL